MSYVHLLSDGQRRARKKHQCFQCYRPIWPGETYHYSTCKYDHVYTLCHHVDCLKASDFYIKFHELKPWDFDEGTPPLADMISDFGEFRVDHDMLRGRFPHVVTRLEFHEQKAALLVNEWEMPQ